MNQQQEKMIDFRPFERTLICPDCNRPLQLMIAPLHLTAKIDCPRCHRPLNAMIEMEISRQCQRLEREG